MHLYFTMRFTFQALLVATAFFTLGDARSCERDLTVKTHGGVVHGKIDSATPSVRQFLGIPYAQPPLDDLRFAPPKPALPFGELNATQYTPACPQWLSLLPNVFVEDVHEFNLGGTNDITGLYAEDCLTLDIYAPRGSSTKTNLPVLIFFYGGAFTNGGTNIPYQIPARWIERTKRHIVVTFNHRDNIFGFPNAAGLPADQQNVGLLDTRLAVEWVRDNIASFGGDPKRIGLWGQSSGGSAIGYYSYIYKDDPIANSVIMDSGNEFIDILTRDDAHGNFTFVASQLGCGGLSAEQELACMRTVDAEKLVQFQHSYYDNGTTPILTFSPVIDNVTIFSNYSALAREGQIAPLPALIGSNAQDGVPFIPYVAEDGGDLASADEITSVWFFCPGFEAGKVRIAGYGGEVPTYRYLYSGNFSNISPRGWMGAWHAAEMPLVFGTHDLYRGNSTELEWETSWAMQDAWLAFVATGGKKMSVEGWDRWDEVDGGVVVEFGNGVPARVSDAREIEKKCAL